MKLGVVTTVLALSCAALTPASAAPRLHVHARTPLGGQALLLTRAVANALPSQAATPVVKTAHKSARLCVGSGSGCYRTLQAAFDASHDGDTIALGRGVFAGGATVTTSVRIVGAGAGATVIKGGGPVLTIGEFGAASEPAVSLDGVTITGGSTSSSAQSVAFPGVENVVALGGGIEVPPGADSVPGASVTISNSVISGNRVAPTATFVPPPDQAEAEGWPMCPLAACPFAQAGGGGIDTAGDLTVRNTRISDNQLGGPVSDADGGGIYAHGGGKVTLIDVVVSGNRASASSPNSRFAEGGGIFASDGATLVIKSSAITSNAVALASTLPYFLADGATIDMVANSGGIHVGDGASVTIDRARIDGNSISVDDANGEPAGFDAGMCICGVSSLVLRRSSVSGNVVVANVASSEHAGASGSALEFDGSTIIDHTFVTGNRSSVTSPSGTAAALGAISAFSQEQAAVISNSVISGNSMSASSPAGIATVVGGGIVNNGLLDLRNDQIRGNAGTASGPAGFAQGGGIWNALIFFDPPVVLSLHSTVVADNTLAASAGLDRQGGGIFTDFPVVLDHSQVTRNDPDQCFGC